MNDTARIAARTSEWASATGVQWKEINQIVDRDMIKSIWRGVADDNIKKGRLKLSQCNNDDIKVNAERIYLDVIGQPLHHTDCPLWFAKMLYMHYVMGRPVDFSSRAPHLSLDDIQSNAITLTRDELGLALQGASCEVHEVREELTQIKQVAQASQAGDAEASNAQRDLQREVKALTRQL